MEGSHAADFAIYSHYPPDRGLHSPARVWAICKREDLKKMAQWSPIEHQLDRLDRLVFVHSSLKYMANLAFVNTASQTAMRKVAHLEDDNGKRGGDLPAILYYREQGIAADQNQHIQVAGVTRFIGEETILDMDAAMLITTIPLTLTYSIVFLAWDRATIERMALAWWAYVAPLGRKHSRFSVPYTLDGESFEVGASLNSPREILTSSEQIGEGDMHLWGSRTMVEVNTQAVYGAKVEIPDHIQIVGDWRLIQ